MAYNPNNPNGQATMANSAPVVLASDQSAVPISSATLATTAKQDTGNTSLSSIDGKLPALGQALAAASVPIVLTAAQISTLTPLTTIPTVTTVTTVTTLTGTTTLTPGTGAANLGKAEDAVHSSGDVGVFALGVANEAQSSLAADGDYIAQATDTKGNRLVIGNIAHDGVDAGAPIKVGGYASAAAPTGVSGDADRVNAWFLRNGAQATVLTAAGALIGGDAANGIDVDVTRLSALVAGAAEIGFIKIASGSVASGAIASGAVASGAFASGSIGSGAIASGAVASGAIASGALASGSIAAGAIAAGATSIAENEDVASADADRGVKVMFKRLDTPANSSGTDGDYEQPQMSAGRLWTSSKIDTAIPAGTNLMGKVGLDQTTPGTTNAVSIAQLGANTISTGVGATGTGVQRVVLANDAGRTLASKGGSASSAGDNTLVVAGTNKLKVYAFSLSTVSTTAVTCIFQSGASGTELWRVILQTPASVAGGANLVVQPPAWLFATASATLLNLNLSAAVAVNWSVSYFDEV